MKKVVFWICLLCLFSYKVDMPAYKLFNKKGKAISFKKLLRKSKDADIVLFGEIHNNTIAHWLELELIKGLYKNVGDSLVIGAEMFESDCQLIIDEYLGGLISESRFESEVRKWHNYNTDYKAFIEFSKEKSISVIATNIPRRYASLVFSKGFEGLNELSIEAKKYICPIPPLYDESLPGYQKMISMGGESRHSSYNFPKAQAIKDATMAYFIHKNIKRNGVFVHVNGKYHSDNFEGIVWYLKQRNQDLKIVTISTVEQDDVDELEREYKGLADYVICVPNTMTKTY